MLKLSLQQKLLQKLSPQQIQLMKLLQIPTIGLEQRIKEELEINPALEEGPDESTDNADADEEFETNEEKDAENSREDFSLDEYIDDDEIPAYKLAVKNSGEDDDRKDIPYSGGNSFQENLLSQLGLRVLDDKDFLIAENLIGNLDEDGYLRRELSSIVDDLAFSQNIMTNEAELTEVLQVIQEFDPAGLGARSLQECLLLQLRRKKSETKHMANLLTLEVAIQIIESNFEEFSKKHYDKISKHLDINDEVLKEAMTEILHLNPRPGNSATDGQKSTQQVIPDFILVNNEGTLELSLNSRNAPDLRVSKSYNDMLEHYSKAKLKDKEKKEAVSFVKQKLDSAKWFIDAIQQRQQTLMITMDAILNYQREYFLEGDETKLRPMILKDIAEIVGMDISTVSRVANSKYIQTPFGTKLLKSFFSESLSTDSGEEVSTKEVKKILEECIAAEKKNKPLTDDKLTLILKEHGYNIARRTVAKYREQLNIPVARLRKEL
ncbi:MAG: RNA polymerase factor sigma-54 [Bacteroidetes bacterium]|nr:RNA polymerase factor sigma-54 [Bacteroidota bacterium]